MQSTFSFSHRFQFTVVCVPSCADSLGGVHVLTFDGCFSVCLQEVWGAASTQTSHKVRHNASVSYLPSEEHEKQKLQNPFQHLDSITGIDECACESSGLAFHTSLHPTVTSSHPWHSLRSTGSNVSKPGKQNVCELNQTTTKGSSTYYR